jgi:trimethylamine--corrinoid protein Co-methyltransferase
MILSDTYLGDWVMQVRKTNYEVNSTPKFQVLSQDEVEAIYFSALRVLYETGVRVYDEEGVEVAYSGGAAVEDTREDSSLVKIPPWMVDKALATTPRKVVLVGPDRNNRMELYKNQIYFGAGSDCPFTIDPYTGERRRRASSEPLPWNGSAVKPVRYRAKKWAPCATLLCHPDG